jgi:hypothetical protein
VSEPTPSPVATGTEYDGLVHARRRAGAHRLHNLLYMVQNNTERAQDMLERSVDAFHLRALSPSSACDLRALSPTLRACKCCCCRLSLLDGGRLSLAVWQALLFARKLPVVGWLSPAPSVITAVSAALRVCMPKTNQ